MKKLTVRLPEHLLVQIEAESRERRLSKSDVVRERLSARSKQHAGSTYEAIADLVGSVRGLPTDLSSRKKHYLKTTRDGRKRHN
jgi:Arc/MetJ-type ribon-helix-helix transcriptional regulator